MLLKVFEGLRNIAIVYREICRAESVDRRVMLIRHHHIHHYLLGGRFIVGTGPATLREFDPLPEPIVA
jgi:hypothetical protein